MSEGLPVLVAGIGNIFLGDDAFGVEVAQRLQQRGRLDEGVRVIDFGIRGYDLAYALLEQHLATVLIDATPRNEPPGTLTVIEADVDAPTLDPAAAPDHGQGAFAGHQMTPAAVFQLVHTLGGHPGRVLVVGCEPETFGDPDVGRMGLSDAVAAVVPIAVETVERLVAELTGSGVAAGA